MNEPAAIEESIFQSVSVKLCVIKKLQSVIAKSSARLTTRPSSVRATAHRSWPALYTRGTLNKMLFGRELERREIFADDRDKRHLLELLAA